MAYHFSFLVIVTWVSECCAYFIVSHAIFYLKDRNATGPRLHRLAKRLSYSPCSSRFFTDDKSIQELGEFLRGQACISVPPLHHICILFLMLPELLQQQLL